MLRKQIPEAKVMIRDIAWHEQHRIDLKLRTTVSRVATEERVVEADGKSYPYDALLVATGGRPNPCPASGAQGAANIFNFQYLDDTRAISEYLEHSKTAVAVGGSYIAYELAEAFSVRGVETHWIIRGPRTLNRVLDEVAAELVAEAAREQNVHLHFGEEVEEFTRSNGVVTKLRTKSGLEIAGECFSIGLGLAMNVELLEGSGIHTSQNGILCNDHWKPMSPASLRPGTLRISSIRSWRFAIAWGRGTTRARTERSQRST
jgi:3-phenylpropionate/trans-cinnamate dioxygenase ferredoxin reductase subunit